MKGDVASIRAHYIEVRRARLAYIRWRAQLHCTRMRRAGNPAVGEVVMKGGDLPESNSTPCPSTGADNSSASVLTMKGMSECDVIEVLS